jgi:uncharacterized membrane protein
MTGANMFAIGWMEIAVLGILTLVAVLLAAWAFGGGKKDA